MQRAFSRLLAEAKHLDGTQLHRGAQFVIDSGRLLRIVWCGAAERELLDFGADARLLQPVAQLLGSQTMEQLICQAHFKLPGDNVIFDWHQDATHRRYGSGDWTDVNGRGSYVQTLTAVDPMTPDNGPLQIIPKSCLLGFLELRQPSDITNHFENSDVLTVTLDPGSVLLFGPYTIHGSFKNESRTPRRAFINGYAYPGANRRQYPGQGAGRTLRAGPE